MPESIDEKCGGHRIFAAFYEWTSRRAERNGTGERRSRLVGDLTGEVLEIGMGNGLNLAHYRQVTRLTAVEPDRFMLRRLRTRVAKVAFPVDVVPTRAESLPFADETFDAVVLSLVLCSVESQPRALGEVARVLKPGGRFRFMEHVRAAGVGGLVLDAIAPAWGFCGGGCQPNRQTEQAIQNAGFAVTAIERYQLGLLPHIQGEAVKSIGGDST